MLDFLLHIPVWMGISILGSFFAGAGLVVVLTMKKILQSRITKQHEKVGRVIFRVTAGLIALLISLSYANERVNQSKIMDSIEVETSMIVNVLKGLNIIDTPESKEIILLLQQYILETLEEEWKEIDDNPYFSDANLKMHLAYDKLIQLKTETKTEYQLKILMIKELNEVSKLSQIKIYSRITHVPYLIYILTIGLFFMWIFFTVYRLDFVALLFLSLYNILIAILIYFVFMLSNPFMGPMKIEPYPFKILKSKAMDTEYVQNRIQ